MAKNEAGNGRFVTIAKGAHETDRGSLEAPRSRMRERRSHRWNDLFQHLQRPCVWLAGVIQMQGFAEFRRLRGARVE